MFIPNPPELKKGKIYRLKKDYKTDLGTFKPPHNFIYMGISGIGNYQDQHDFIDNDDKKISFCPALKDDWSEYLEITEE